MRFLVDESTGPRAAQWLRGQGHDVFSVYDEARGVDDDVIIQKVFAENWILITNDKDFGEKIFRGGSPHHGVILLRLADERAAVKIAALERLLENFANRLENQFIVVTENAIRLAKGR